MSKISTPITAKVIALVLAFLSCAQAQAQIVGGWGQGYQPEIHQSDPNAPYILLPPYTGTENGIGELTQYRTLIAQAPLDLTDNGPTMQLTLNLNKVPINLGGTDGTTQQEAVDNILNFSGVSAGDLVKYNGTNWVRFPKGTANQVLKMDGTGTDFAWTNQGSIINANAEFIVSASDGSMPNADILTGGTGITVTNGTNTSTVAIDSTVATLTGTQTLTNKTLTAPKISYTGLVLKGNLNDGTVTWADWAGTRDLVIPDPGTASSTNFVLSRGTQTLDGTYTFTNAPKLATNTLTSSTGNTITFPNSSDTVVYLNATQELANKTLNAPSFSNASTMTLQQTGGNYTISWANPTGARAYTFYDANGNGDIAIKSGTATAGSVAYGDGYKIQFTGAGTAGQAFKSNGASAPDFGVIDLRGGGLGINSLANQSLIVGNGTNTVSTLAKGSANQILMMDGTGTNIIWNTFSPGTVTNVSTGDLSPLFTTSVANSSTAPSISFSLTAAAAGTIFGNFASISGTPSYNLPGSSNQVLGVKSGGGLEYKTVSAGTNITVSHSTGTITLKATAPGTQGCRISIDKLQPVTIDGANSYIYLVPQQHGRISLYTSGNEWIEDSVDVLNPPSLSVPATTSTTYDVYASDTGGSGTVTLGTNAWSTAGTFANTDYGAGYGFTAICVGADGNYWVYDATGNRISKITPAGVKTDYSVPTAGANIWQMCLGPDGNVWFAEYSKDKIGKITTSGTITEYNCPGVSAGPYGICAGPDGRLWITEENTNKVAKVTTAGSFTEYTIPTGSAGPRVICVGPDGNLWFTEKYTNKIAKVTTAGSFTEYSVPTASANPEGICAGADGNLWFTEDISPGNDKLGRVTPLGAFLEYTVATGSTVFTRVRLGPDGNVWATSTGGNRMASVTPGGTLTEYTHALGSMTDLTLGTDNKLWYVSSQKVGTCTADAPPTRGQQDGVWWTGNAQQRLIGCIRTGSVSGIVPDNIAQRFVYNWDNQVESQLRGQQTSSTWTYASTTTRAANANTTDGQGKVSLLLGRPTIATAEYDCAFVATSTNATVGIGLDGTSNTAQRTSVQQVGLGLWNNVRATQQALVYPGVHYFQALEACTTAATVTFYGTNPLSSTNATPFGASSLLTVESKR